ncbi:unnamed protein product [Blepharisma stoltei]|uniref:Uncharacterized protein n=1 Tax=Blepharisma stoltei TaxID=1481888 RepID=A0AAU9IZV8_9CILI|nr:unnamed protein product [Blepharisma stoltei]
MSFMHFPSVILGAAAWPSKSHYPEVGKNFFFKLLRFAVYVKRDMRTTGPLCFRHVVIREALQLDWRFIHELDSAFGCWLTEDEEKHLNHFSSVPRTTQYHLTKII